MGALYGGFLYEYNYLLTRYSIHSFSPLAVCPKHLLRLTLKGI